MKFRDGAGAAGAVFPESFPWLQTGIRTGDDGRLCPDGPDVFRPAMIFPADV